ncbi:MAG: cobalamin-dependent protein [Oscillospiraceae bacterium]|nr:cobalamin-dependent protein [Oscillospiraceae bacterium]
MAKGLVIAASLGNCVHVAGAVHFLNLARDEGYATLFLGPAVKPEDLLARVRELEPAIVSVGYRLTPESGLALAAELMERSRALEKQPVWALGCTRPVAERARELGFFDVIFDGTDDIDDSIAFLRYGAIPGGGAQEYFARGLTERIAQKRPYPLLRHHFGLPSYDDTLRGIETIAESRALDVISLGIDQNTQQYFFRQESRDGRLEGAGGVPVRSEDEFRRLRQAARRGNFPLMRCYSGTADVMRFGEMLLGAIDNAWCAAPLCWYNELDGRGERTLRESVEDAQRLIAFHGGRGVPVEVNEPHHWGLRDAHDVISVAMSYISAYNAKKYGARDYVSQYMFNIPNSLTFSMDLAKVMAQVSMTESLADSGFRVYREVRAGLPFLSGDPNVAKGQLAASTALAMNIDPHIIHVVGYSEAEYAATPEVVVESCGIVRGVVRSTLFGNADATADRRVTERRAELMREAEYLLGFIDDAYSGVSSDPLGDAAVIADCVKRGILDAPHIVRRDGADAPQTRVIDGKCVAWDPDAGAPVCERERLGRLGISPDRRARAAGSGGVRAGAAP